MEAFGPNAPKPPDPNGWKSRRGRVELLADTWGELRLQVDGVPSGILRVAGGAVEIAAAGGGATAVDVDSEPTLLRLLAGQLHPFMAHLQGRLRVRGDRALAFRILFILQVDSPWSSLEPAAGEPVRPSARR